MKSLKWEGIGTKNLFPHTSSLGYATGGARVNKASIFRTRLFLPTENSVSSTRRLSVQVSVSTYVCDSTDSPDCLPILLSITVFLLFLVFHFLVVGSGGVR